MRLGLHYKPNPGKQEDGSRLHGCGLALALLPDPQLMLHVLRLLIICLEAMTSVYFWFQVLQMFLICFGMHMPETLESDSLSIKVILTW